MSQNSLNSKVGTKALKVYSVILIVFILGGDSI
jgi:hypothetical protein